jgi:hypothetical protein
MNYREAPTTELLLEFVSLSPRWRAILRVRALGHKPFPARPGCRPVRMLSSAHGHLVEVEDPTPEEEERWNALTAEINRRIPSGGV